MKYSKEVREKAALICAIAASTPDLDQAYNRLRCLLDKEVGADDEADDLAMAAWRVTQYSDFPDAEAEALLRTGWEP